MILKSKICRVSDSRTLSYIINHNHPPQFIGFIVNYPKSKRKDEVLFEDVDFDALVYSVSMDTK